MATGVTIQRIIRGGFMSFWRNGWVSLTATLVMTLAVFVIGSLLFSNVLLTSALSQIEGQVDISVYFRTDAAEQDILAANAAIAQLPQVRSIAYVSRDDALAKFRARHAGNALITQSLDELADNPLQASLNIRAESPEQYEVIARFLESSVYQAIIDKVNYFQNQVVIERLSKVLSAGRAVGLGITIALAAIAVLVVLNTIRLAIYVARDEISVMKVVGASSAYVRGPFVVSGALYGIFAAFITTVLFYPLTFWFGPQAAKFFGGLNLFHYYLAHFFQIFLILLSCGILLGTLSSVIAIRRYLKV
ncbi:MAG: ABC transporter permease [Candidatus Niyogibacteria bacterium]|nr:ABC transporter permease [Candidatus Niyogibacteria bacterium]